MPECPSFFRVNNIPWYGHTTIFFIRPSWTLGWFHLQPVVNNAAGTVGVRVSESQLSLLLVLSPEVGLLGCRVVLFLDF